MGAINPNRCCNPSHQVWSDPHRKGCKGVGGVFSFIYISKEGGFYRCLEQIVFLFFFFFLYFYFGFIQGYDWVISIFTFSLSFIGKYLYKIISTPMRIIGLFVSFWKQHIWYKVNITNWMMYGVDSIVTWCPDNVSRATYNFLPSTLIYFFLLFAWKKEMTEVFILKNINWTTL